MQVATPKENANTKMESRKDRSEHENLKVLWRMTSSANDSNQLARKQPCQLLGHLLQLNPLITLPTTAAVNSRTRN